MEISHEVMIRTLKRLNLTWMSNQYVEQAKLSEKEKHTYEKYLWCLARQEAQNKDEAHIKKLIYQASFPLEKSIETYQWEHREGITPKQLERLCQGSWVRNGENVVFYGSFGVGKTHLAIGIGRQLCAQKLKVIFYSTHNLILELQAAKNKLELTTLLDKLDRFDLIICDELGYLPQSQDGADLFFQLISQRSERRSLMFTTNLLYSEWDKVFLNPLSTKAAVDRIIHRCETFNLKGPSKRAEEAERRVNEFDKQGSIGQV